MEKEEEEDDEVIVSIKARAAEFYMTLCQGTVVCL